jgi:hypothetical protein
MTISYKNSDSVFNPNRYLCGPAFDPFQWSPQPLHMIEGRFIDCAEITGFNQGLQRTSASRARKYSAEVKTSLSSLAGSGFPCIAG